MKTFAKRSAVDDNRVASAIHAAVDQAADATKPAIDRAASSVHEAVDGAMNVAGSAVEWLGEKNASVTASRRKLLANSCNYVSKHPVKSVGLALVAGILIAKIAF